MEGTLEQELARKELIAEKLKQEGKDSAHNSDEDEEMRDAREHKEEKDHASLINFNLLGSEECPIDPEASDIEYSMIWRIPRIENLEQCKDLRVSQYFGFIMTETWTEKEPNQKD